MKKNIFTGIVIVMMIIATSVPVFADSIISEREAIQIAMQNAGVEEADVSYVRVCTYENHELREYDVKFYVGDQEYDYEIAAVTGEVRSANTKNRYESANSTASEMFREMNTDASRNAFRKALDEAGVN